MMQVQIIENQADVVGTIRAVSAHQTLANFYTLKFDVEDVAPVGSLPNLLASAKGMSIEITASAEELARRKLAAGQKVTLRVKKSGPAVVFLIPEKTDTR